MAKVSTKTDNFTSFDSSFWSFSYGTATVSSGRGNTSTTSGGSGFFSGTNTWDLTDSAISLQVIQVPTTTNTYAILQMQQNGSNLVEMGVFQGVLYAKKKVAGTDTGANIDTFNATKHAYWRIRETSSNLYFEYSANGVDWAIGYTTSSPGFLTAMYIHMGSGGATGSTFIFDNLNIVPTTFNKYGYDDSGTPTLFGVYKGYGQSAINDLAGHESLVGRQVEIGSDYLPHDSWSQFNASSMRTNQLDPWRTWRDSRPNSKFVYGIPVLTDSNPGDFSGVTSGTYNTYFDTAAQALVDSGHPDAIIRLGWEPNNPNIGSWQATTNPTGYKNAYQHIVTRFRAVGGQQFKFELSSALGLPLNQNLTSFEQYYPGDSYVDYIGMNVYDMWPGMPNLTPAERWMRQRTCVGGLDDHVAFVQSKGKINICSEWGLYAANGSPDYDGGGDNPTFISNMKDYFQWGNVWYQVYFDFNWGGGSLSNYTNGQTRYVSLFQNRRAADTEIAPTPKSSSETGQSTETHSITATTTSTDTSSGADTQSLVTSQTRTDTSSGTETSSIAVSFTRTDTALATESHSIQVIFTGTDTSSGVDTSSITASLTKTDTASGLDGGSIDQGEEPVNDDDTVSTSEELSLSATVTTADTGTVTETHSIAVSFNSSDSASGVDGAFVGQFIDSNDSVTATESVTGMAATISRNEDVLASDDIGDDFNRIVATLPTQTDTGSATEDQDASLESDNPNPPSNLIALAVSSSQINLSWNTVPGASYYQVERDGVVINDHVTATSFEDKGLAPRTIYTYRVRAVRVIF